MNRSSRPLSFDSAEIASRIPSSSSREGLGTPEYPRASHDTLIIFSFASHLASESEQYVSNNSIPPKEERQDKNLHAIKIHPLVHARPSALAVATVHFVRVVAGVEGAGGHHGFGGCGVAGEGGVGGFGVHGDEADGEGGFHELMGVSGGVSVCV